jgi:hypothetical protein
MRASPLSLLGITTAFFLYGCQTNLPTLETSPDGPGLKIQNVVDHIQCELALIVNAPNDSSRLAKRVNADPQLASLLPKLAEDHFVATAQLSLEVTDTNGLAPSLNFLNSANTFAFSLGGQLNGTQDRNVTVNYGIDLGNLQDSHYKNDFCKPFVGGDKVAVDTVDGIGGDLGLADTVADGLLALDAGSSANAYPTTGPTPIAFERRFSIPGKITSDSPAVDATIESLKGTILVSPHTANSATQGTVTVTGIATIMLGGKELKFLANWTGALIPQDSVGSTDKYTFSLTGSLVPVAYTDEVKDFITLFGYNPMVTLTGSIVSAPGQADLMLSGILTPSATSTGSLKFAKLVLHSPAPPPPGAQISTTAFVGAAAAKAPSSSSGSASGTSFGSLITFTLVYGANGGPNWTLKTFKGPSGGSTPFVSASRTRTDSLSITFVAACRDIGNASSNVSDYWSSIGACDDLGAAVAQSAQIGYQNNSLMILKNLIQRPNPAGTP